MNLLEFNTHFEPYFFSVFDEYITRATAITSTSENHLLLAHARKISAKGKRIRPYLCYLSYISTGGASFDDIKDIAVALELIHLFALIQDDVMDESGLRRGVPTTHMSYSDMTTHATSQRSGESMAILLADLIYTWALEIATNYFIVTSNDLARESFFTLLREVIHGQMIDIVVSDASTVTSEQLREKNHLKTSSYTFIRPMEMGCLLSGSPTDSKMMMEAGLALGEAFQVIDDVIDVVGNSKTSLKDICLDIETGQHTQISQFIQNECTEEILTKFNTYINRSLSDKEKEEVQNIILNSGAIDASKKHAKQEITNALEILDNLVSENHMTYWKTLGKLLANRMA